MISETIWDEKILGQDKIQYVLHLADNSLVMGHRLSEWAGHGPVLEQDIALSNIALDHIGQARNFYQYAAKLAGKDVTEDHLAYFRNAGDYRNIVLVELENGDWGNTLMKLFLFSSYQQLLFEHLSASADSDIAGIAGKSLKEVIYHVRWSGEWIIRLGDGTDESNKKMMSAANHLWPYTEELFTHATYETAFAIQEAGKIALKQAWLENISGIFHEATLELPTNHNTSILSGKEGKHSEHLEVMLKEMQVLQRTYPGCQW